MRYDSQSGHKVALCILNYFLLDDFLLIFRMVPSKDLNIWDFVGLGLNHLVLIETIFLEQILEFERKDEI